MGVMLLCSGQGSQHPAMFARLKDEPAAQAVLDAASSRLGVDVRNLEADSVRLDFTANRVAQILVTAHCLAVRAVLGDELGDICVGYSVGEIAAAACAGAIDVGAAFDLIEERARCMDDAAASSGGSSQGMLAVVGIPLLAIEAIAEEAGAAIAIVNGADHVVIGGPGAALDRIEPSLAAKGARNVRRLPVQIASHTRFMAGAGPAFADALTKTKWRTPRIPVLSGVDGRRILSQDDALRAFSEQLWKRLDFMRCLEMARERGASCALEIGPGRSLVRLISELLPDVHARAFEDFRTSAGPSKWLASGL